MISRSMFVYLMQISDQVSHESWRDDAEAIFRDAKRRGAFQPIKSKNITVQFNNVPIVTRNGDIISSDRREVLYTTRDHGSMDDKPADVVRQAVFRNLHTISRWKRESTSQAKRIMINVEEEIKSQS